MRVVVAGGAGFIGSCFVKLILNGEIKGYDEVLVIDKLTYSGNLKNFESKHLKHINFIRGDICDKKLLETLIKKDDVIINFAAESHVDRSIKNASPFILTNVLGTQTLVDVAFSKKAKKYIQISTDEVYGSIDSGSWNEQCILNPNSPYAASKASADLITLSYFRTFGFDVRITRCGNNYGSHQYPEKLIPVIITNLIRGKKIPIYGNGLNIREWIHVTDHCKAIDLVIKNGQAGQIYNVGEGTSLDNLSLVEKILQVFQKTKNEIIYVPDRLGHDLRYSMDSSYFKRSLNFTPEVQFEKGLLETIMWYKDHPEWWLPLIKK